MTKHRMSLCLMVLILVSGCASKMEQRLTRDYNMPSRVREPIDVGINPEVFQLRVKQFLEALISQDYQTAKRISYMDVGPTQRDRFQEVLSVGEPFQLKTEDGISYAKGRHIYVPFEVKRSSGDIYRAVINMRNDKAAIENAKSLLGIPIPDDEWVFDGGF